MEDKVKQLYFNGNYKKANKNAKKGLKKDPDNGELMLYNALTLEKLGKIEEAYEAFDKLSQVHSKDVTYISEKSRFLYDVGKINSYQKHLDEVITLIEVDENLWRELFDLIIKVRDFHSGVKGFIKLVLKFPGNQKILDGLGQLQTRLVTQTQADADVKIKLNQSAEALNIYHLALDLLPSNKILMNSKAEIHFTLSTKFKQSGNYFNANLELDNAIKLDPDNVNLRSAKMEILEILGSELRESGKLIEALEVIEETLELDPSNYLARRDKVKILLNLANKNRTDGRLEDAVWALNQVLMLEPENILAIYDINQLRESNPDLFEEKQEVITPQRQTEIASENPVSDQEQLYLSLTEQLRLLFENQNFINQIPIIDKIIELDFSILKEINRSDWIDYREGIIGLIEEQRAVKEYEQKVDQLVIILTQNEVIKLQNLTNLIGVELAPLKLWLELLPSDIGLILQGEDILVDISTLIFTFDRIRDNFLDYFTKIGRNE
ncbi:MAG: hypothetical protein IH840_10310 [Candidatus Heimdallarchaeota archaeon]|nr:hypothetical protein [Candidatus Heimdallarchaeota archaeon]